jgi:PPM family protein phosphatase
MLIYSGFHTDVGKVRKRNEDALYQDPIPLGYLVAVADGMGGHEQGDKAATMTLSSISSIVEREKDDPADALRRGFEAANLALRNECEQLGVTMGATCVAAVISNRQLYISHVGDARLYLLRGASLYLLTRDHSLMQELADIKGPVAATEFAPSLKHIMSRSVGAEGQIQVAQRPPIPLRAGDMILLCTDGLTNSVPDARIRRVLAGSTPREAARRLVEMSNEQGGEDNTTVVVLRVDTGTGGADRAMSFDDLTSMFVRTANGDLHPIIDLVINPSTWTITELRLDLRNLERGATCAIPTSEVGPIPCDEQVIQTPRCSEALLDLARGRTGPAG